MAEIVWTPEAARWLEEIYDYIAAGRVVKGIYEKAQLLRDQPRLGQRYESIADREVREILTVVIEILGVFHSAMEIQRYLKDDSKST